MASFILDKISISKQYIISVILIAIVALGCYMLSSIIGYKVVALLLLVTVSLIAMFFEIKPVLLAALLSALVWDFFFIPPKFTFHINDTEDALMLLMYFFIAMVNAVLTHKIRKFEKEANRKEEKENTLKLYNTLLNSLSHELRTPLSAILGATDNLLSASENLTEQNKKELIKEISKASLRLNRQVENLLNMSRLESGFIQVKNDWCDVNELIYDIVKRVREDFEHCTVGIVIKENLPLFKLDHGLIEQVIYNLILNAALYIPKYCVVTVKADVNDDKLILTVEDNGRGFPEDEIDHVFEKFYRLKNSIVGGTGLGLSIVKGFVDAHHGSITLKNLAEGGACFRIEIPAETSYLSSLKNE